MSLLDLIERERREVADHLEQLTDEQLTTQSCCADWTVLEVAAHLTQGWNYSTAHGMWQMLKARGDLGKVSSHCLAPLAAAGVQSVIADLRANARDTFKPPGLGFEAPLNDLVLHRRDMLLPLGISYEPNPDALPNSLDMATKTGMVAMVNNVKQLRGLRCVATDIDWHWGDGPELQGPALPLAHAMWGRTESLAELEGDGVEIFRSRLT